MSPPNLIQNLFLAFDFRNIDLSEILTEENKLLNKHTKYNLVANIVHDGEPKDGSYRTQIFHKSTNEWYEMQDLHVTNLLPQMISLTEAYVQIYEQQLGV
jgi:U4/U6.U5 tri-snRNP-associated protein 2